MNQPSALAHSAACVLRVVHVGSYICDSRDFASTLKGRQHAYGTMLKRNRESFAHGNGATPHAPPVGLTAGKSGWCDRPAGINIKIAAADSSIQRDLDCVEIFSGVGSIVTAALQVGCRATGFDRVRVPGVTDIPGEFSEDILSDIGFCKALHLVQRVRVGGLVWLAPMCNSFNWLCTHQSKRRAENGWTGDEGRSFVAEGNRAATLAFYLATLANMRGAAYVVENPPRSLLWNYLESQLGPLPACHISITCDRCAFNTPSSATVEISKKYRLVGNMSWLSELERKCQCPFGREHLSLTKVVQKKSGKKRTGIPKVMALSAEYPLGMGVAVVQAWTYRDKIRGPTSSIGGSCRRSWRRSQSQRRQPTAVNDIRSLLPDTSDSDGFEGIALLSDSSSDREWPDHDQPSSLLSAVGPKALFDDDDC